MDLKDFERIINFSDREYNILLEKKFWRNFDSIDEKCAEAILRFLKAWGIRAIPNLDNDKRKNYVEKIKRMLIKTLKELKKDSEKLESVKLINCEFNDEQKQTIKNIFKNLDYVPQIGKTAVSKIMHLALPNLFVMWDKKISERYNCKRTEDCYLEFLENMQIEAKNLLEQFKKKNHLENISDSEAQNRFEEKYRKKLTKLIDEYNWHTIARKEHNNHWDRIEKMNI